MARLNQAVGLLLLLCGLASAQNPIPSTSAYEDHGAYSINLQDLSIVFPVNFRQKSGLIPFSAGGYSVGNHLLSAQSHQGSAIYMGASYTGTVSPVVFPIGAFGSKGAAIMCGGTPSTYPYTWSVITADGDYHLLQPIPGSNPYVDMMSNGTSCYYNSMTATTIDGTGITLKVTVNPNTLNVYGPSGEHFTGTPAGLPGTLSFNVNSFYDSNGNSLSQQGGGGLNTTTTEAITTLGMQVVTVANIVGFNPPVAALIDTGANQEVVNVLSIQDPAFKAYFTKTHASGVPVVTVNEYTDSLGLSALSYETYPSQIASWTDVNGGRPQVSMSQISLIQDTAFGCPSPNEDWTLNTIPAYYMSGVSYANGTSLGITYEQTPGKSASYTTGRITGLTLPTGGTVSFTYTGFQCTYLEPTTFKRITSDGTWTYTWTPTTTGNTTTVVDPAGNATVYTFQQTLSGPFLTSKVVNQGASTVLSSTSLCYNGSCPGLTAYPFPITQIDTYTTLGGMSTAKRTSKTFDTMGNELTSSSYDFGAGTPTFATTTIYGTWNGSGCSAIGNYVINKPCTVSTTQNGTLIAQSRYTYDAHGNRLSSSSMANGSTWLTASATYNSFGTMATSVAVDGVAASYTYDACGGAFPNQATVGGITTNAAWNCDGGVQTSSTDGNGAITQYGYTNQGGTADPLWRVSSVTDPLGSVTYTTYGSNTMETTLSFGSSVEDSIVTVDGYGRTIRKQIKDGSSYDTVSTKYNFAASTISTSIPCLVALGSDCTTGFTVSTMDGAGRTSSTVDGGGGTLTNAFLKNDVVSTLAGC